MLGVIVISVIVLVDVMLAGRAGWSLPGGWPRTTGMGARP